MSNAEAEIRSTIHAWLAAVQAQNPAAIAQIHAEDARILLGGSPVVLGRAAIEDFWKGLIEVTNGTVVFGPTTIEVDAADSMAFEVGTYSFTAAGVENAGNYLVVWKKIDGEWKVGVDALVAG